METLALISFIYVALGTALFNGMLVMEGRMNEKPAFTWMLDVVAGIIFTITIIQII